MMTAPPVISIKNLRIALPEGAERPFAVDGISLDLKAGKIVCVVGESRNELLALITLKEAILMDCRFVPGAIEGLTVEDESLKKRVGDAIEALNAGSQSAGRDRVAQADDSHDLASLFALFQFDPYPRFCLWDLVVPTSTPSFATTHRLPRPRVERGHRAGCARSGRRGRRWLARPRRRR